MDDLENFMVTLQEHLEDYLEASDKKTNPGPSPSVPTGNSSVKSQLGANSSTVDGTTDQDIYGFFDDGPFLMPQTSGNSTEKASTPQTLSPVTLPEADASDPAEKDRLQRIFCFANDPFDEEALPIRLHPSNNTKQGYIYDPPMLMARSCRMDAAREEQEGWSTMPSHCVLEEDYVRHAVKSLERQKQQALERLDGQHVPPAPPSSPSWFKGSRSSYPLDQYQLEKESQSTKPVAVFLKKDAALYEQLCRTNQSLSGSSESLGISCSNPRQATFPFRAPVERRVNQAKSFGKLTSAFFFDQDVSDTEEEPGEIPSAALYYPDTPPNSLEWSAVLNDEPLQNQLEKKHERGQQAAVSLKKESDPEVDQPWRDLLAHVKDVVDPNCQGRQNTSDAKQSKLSDFYVETPIGRAVPSKSASAAMAPLPERRASFLTEYFSNAGDEASSAKPFRSASLGQVQDLHKLFKQQIHAFNTQVKLDATLDHKANHIALVNQVDRLGKDARTASTPSPTPLRLLKYLLGSRTVTRAPATPSPLGGTGARARTGQSPSQSFQERRRLVEALLIRQKYKADKILKGNAPLSMEDFEVLEWDDQECVN